MGRDAGRKVGELRRPRPRDPKGYYKNFGRQSFTQRTAGVVSLDRGIFMSAVTQSITADELLAMPKDGYRYELVKGELRKMAPAGDEHGFVAMNFGSFLTVHVKANNLGR